MTISAPARPAPASPPPAPRFTPLDYSRSIPEEKDVPPRPLSFLGVADIERVAHGIAKSHPDLVKVVDIGDSGEKIAGRGGNDVFALRIEGTGTSDGPRERVVLTSGIHPREVVPPAVLLKWAEQATNLYGTDPAMTSLLDDKVIDIVPAANPDGLSIVERGLRREPGGAHLQRTNTTPPHGVNINRNFPTPSWGVDTPNSGPDLQNPENSDGNYSGPNPGSEPETRILQKFLGQEPTAAYSDWHTTGEFVLSPPTGGTAATRAESERLADAVADTLGVPSVQTPTDLAMAIDWAQADLNIPSILAEIGGEKFIPDDPTFGKVYARTAPAITEFVRQAGNRPAR